MYQRITQDYHCPICHTSIRADSRPIICKECDSEPHFTNLTEKTESKIESDEYKASCMADAGYSQEEIDEALNRL